MKTIPLVVVVASALVGLIACHVPLSSMVGTTPIITEIGPCGSASCAKVTLSPLPPLPESIPAASREAIYTSVAAVLYAPIGPDAQSSFTPQAVIAAVQELFEDEGDVEDGSIPTSWELERTAAVLFSNDDVVTVDVRSHGYLGGAHGFDERTLITFLSRDGARVKITDLIDTKSLSLLSTIAEAEFRRVRSIPTNQTLQDAGFSLPVSEPFPIPDNFGVVEQGLLVRFNPYEIAPYNLGATEITLPKEAISSLLIGSSSASVPPTPASVEASVQ